MFYFYVQEYGNEWVGDEPLKDLLELMESSPFGSFAEMEFNSSLQWKAYDREKALRTLSQGKKVSVGFRCGSSPFAEASISRNPTQNTLTFNFAPEYLQTLDLAGLLDFIRKIANLFPRFGSASLDGFRKRSSVPALDQLRDLPISFGLVVTFYKLLSAAVYEEYFKKEDLLNAPFQHVAELENGWLELIAYSDPLAYNTPETQEKIVEITRYLNNCRFDKF
jgi:hypothetical protein